MPRVPVQDEQNVAVRQLPDIRLSADAPLAAFGGGAALNQATDAALGVGQTAVNLSDKWQAEADKSRYREIRSAVNEWERQNIHDPQTGASNKVGREAFEIDKTLGDSWTKFVGEQRKGIRGTALREKTEELFSLRGDETQEWALNHIAKQTEVVKEASIESAIESSKERASTNPATMEMERVMIADAVMDRWAGRQDPEFIRQEIQRHQTDMHKRVINRMLANGNDQVAQEYFDKHRGSMDPDEVTGMITTLREGEVRGEGQRLADTAWVKADGDFGEAMEMVRKENDPDVRKKAEADVRRRNADVLQAERQERDDIYTNAATSVERTPGASPRDLVPPDDWVKMTPEQRSSLERRSVDPENDTEAWLDMLDLVKEDPNAFVGLNRSEFESKYWSRFDNAHKRTAEGMWMDGRSGKTEKVTDALSFDDRVRNTMEGAGLVDPDKTRKKMKDREQATYRNFENEAAVRRQDFEEKNGRKPRGDEMQAILNEMVNDKVVVRRRFLPDPEVSVFDPRAVAQAEERKSREVMRRMKDGRVAVFDGDSKEFVRWQ